MAFFSWLVVTGADDPPGNSVLVAEDIFGRRINERGITLVDWDGYIANPLITIYLAPPPGAVLPGTAMLTSGKERLYFDTPSDVGSSGPRKDLVFRTAADRVPVKLSVFPDRDREDEEYELTIVFIDRNAARSMQAIPIRVLDLDQQQTNAFQVTVNFDRDATSFFADQTLRALVEQAADDWAYFFDDMALDRVPIGDESTYIWHNNFASGYFFKNTNSYQGYLLYAYGTTNQLHRSGGEGNHGGPVQRSGGQPLTIKRSGGFEAEIHGNYNTLGWLLLTNDNQWHATGNLGHETNDFYSIAHHEIGHALVFNTAHPGFNAAKSTGAFRGAAVTNYFGGRVPIDATDHINGAIDPESGQGAFGYEYFGEIPRRRWLITKLDLLCAQEVGYKLRDSPTLAPLTLRAESLPEARVQTPYAFQFHASGGIPILDFSIIDGALPPGMTLDRFTGVLSGVPSASGRFDFTVRVRDYTSSNAITGAYALDVLPTPPLILSVDSVERSGEQQIIRLRVSGFVSGGGVIEASTDLASWSAIATNVAAAAPLNVTETNQLVRARYYRAVKGR